MAKKKITLTQKNKVLKTDIQDLHNDLRTYRNLLGDARKQRDDVSIEIKRLSDLVIERTSSLEEYRDLNTTIEKQLLTAQTRADTVASILLQALQAK